jgi:hypothetical protein
LGPVLEKAIGQVQALHFDLNALIQAEPVGNQRVTDMINERQELWQREKQLQKLLCAVRSYAG